jgi:DNA repair protein RecO (recombination protein O)
VQFRAPAIVCASRPHGETAVIARLFGETHGLVAVYIAGGRSSRTRPLLIPGNLVEAEVTSRSEVQMPWARVELLQSRGPLMGEALPAAAIVWVTTLAAATLPERHPYPALYAALDGVLGAITFAPAAKGWVGAMLDYEALVLRELGYGETATGDPAETWDTTLARFDAMGRKLARYPLAQGRGDVMAARTLLRDRLARIGG